MKSIAIFFGGQSVEHDVSVITGVMTTNALKKEYDAIPVYVDANGEWWTGEILKDIDFYKEINYKKIKKVSFMPGCNYIVEIKNKKQKNKTPISAVINCIHGERGEDGSLAGLLKMIGIPLVSPDILSSSVFMDKTATKIFLKGLNIPTLSYGQAKSIEDGEEISKKLGFPLVVKPVHGGSSIGVCKAYDDKSLKSGLRRALSFDSRVILEPKAENFIEINQAVYRSTEGLVLSELERPIGKDEVLSFDDKYSFGKREFPAKVSKETKKKISEYSERIYNSLDMTGVIRIDYFVIDGKVKVNEINTVPGSMAYYLFSEKTEDFLNMLKEMVTVALNRSSLEQSISREFSSGILKVTGAKGSKRL